MNRRTPAALALALLIGLICIGAATTQPAAPTTAPAQAKGEPADNSYCFACHANFRAEAIASDHQKIGVGCTTCHGQSDAHNGDENGIIAPDVMFAKSQINTACTACHAKNNLLDASRKLTNPMMHGPIFTDNPGKEKYCTDCHGKHTMPVRTRRWDKATHKLIADDGVRMVKDEPGPAKGPGNAKEKE